eukprot:4612254-Pyramimonas_sp.AAC.1
MAGSDALTLLLQMHAPRKIMVEHVASICYNGSKAGIKGSDWARYAVKPGQGTGNYQQHLDRVISPPAGLLEDATVP